MAYLTYLASVPEDRLAAYREDGKSSLKSTLTREVSHLIAYWVEPQPFRRLLGEAIDGGQILSPLLWHPFRVPLFHDSRKTRELSLVLTREYIHLTHIHPPLPEDDWYKVEVEKVLEVLGHAADRGECFVSMLESPSDGKRASRVVLPRLT